MARTRKTPQTWITAGLKALTKHGPDGIRAETLARSLGATKGSFYWHFKDVPAFRDALLKEWRAGADKRLASVLGDEDLAAARLRALAGFKMTPLDRAVRAWAQTDPAARKAVASFDKVILDDVESCLTPLNITNPDFPALILAALVASPKGGTHAATLIDVLLMLK